MLKQRLFKILAFAFFVFSVSGLALSQPVKSESKSSPQVRTVTIPISIFTRKELKEKRTEEFVQTGDLTVKEANDEQVVLSIRSVTNTKISLAVLIQDDLSPSANLQLKDLAAFIKNLPTGSRVMIAYLRSGSIQIRQKFTEDLEKAVNSLRIVAGTASAAPGSPFQAVEEALKRFDAVPTGRRAILLVSDGLDVSQGVESSSPTQSSDLKSAILKAQRKGVPIYSFYNAATYTENGNFRLISNGQGSLERLSEETGGRAFFQGTNSPISFQPFLEDVELMLQRQFSLTYLSTHMKKGYYQISVTSSNPDVKIQHPKGYFYK